MIASRMRRRVVQGLNALSKLVYPDDHLKFVDSQLLERALFHKSPVRQFGDGRALAACPPPDGLGQIAERRFYHVLPWLYRSNARVDPFIAEHQIAEGLCLFERCREKSNGILVEVGRRIGGSTLLMAWALGEGRLYSVDLEPVADATIGDYLRILGLDDRVQLDVGDSTSYRPEGVGKIDLLFLDGCKASDEAVGADLSNYGPLMSPGGLLLMHDYNEKPVIRAVEHLTSSSYRLVEQVGLLVVMEKR